MVVTVEGKGNQGKHNGLYGNNHIVVDTCRDIDFYEFLALHDSGTRALMYDDIGVRHVESFAYVHNIKVI